MNCKDLNDLLDKIAQTDSENVVSLYFGDFTKLHENKSATTLIIDDKDKISKCIRNIQGMLKQRYENKSLSVYQHRDMFLKIDDQNNREYILEKHLKTLICDNVCAIIRTVINIPKESFPVLDKYTYTGDQKVKIINGDSCVVHFIEQNDKMSIRVDFTNKGRESREECEKIVNKIILSNINV